MATIDEKAMNGADLRRFAALVKKTATQSLNGMMSKEDKVKLDGVTDEKVNQTAAAADDVSLPILLANGATPSNGGVQYDTDLKYNPVTNTLSIDSGTLTGTNYSGTASRATSDGAGNNIASTYATKEEVMSQHPTVVTSLPTADGTHSGLYFVRNASFSTPTKNVYDEYIEVNTGTDSVPVWVWEQLGSTDVTLNVAYLTTSEVETIWNETQWT